MDQPSQIDPTASPTHVVVPSVLHLGAASVDGPDGLPGWVLFELRYMAGSTRMLLVADVALTAGPAISQALTDAAILAQSARRRSGLVIPPPGTRVNGNPGRPG
jgi:hypothetical protein